jgi:hypothetical protein
MKMIITDDEGYSVMINPMHIIKVEKSCEQNHCFIYLHGVESQSYIIANENFDILCGKINKAMENK